MYAAGNVNYGHGIQPFQKDRGENEKGPLGFSMI